MRTVSGLGTSSKKVDTDKNQEHGEEEEEGEEEECEDRYGSRVVATLCRNVKQPSKGAADNDLVIAVVVTSSGTRHDARKCADAHIKKLKTKPPEDDKIIKCEMIAQINQKAAARAKKEALKGQDGSEDGDGDGGESDNGDESEEASASAVEDANKDEEGEGPKKPYTSGEFMASFYTKDEKYPLYDSGTTKKKAIRYLQENATALKQLGKKTTWIIPHESVTGDEASATHDYHKGNNGNKTVVVVLSAFFLLSKNQQKEEQAATKKQATSENQTHKKVTTMILVCNIPAPPKINKTNQEEASTHYRDAFNQVKAFIEHYNDEIASEAKKIPKIERIALSYPLELYRAQHKNTQKKVKVQKKAAPKKAGKQTVAKKPAGAKAKQASAGISSISNSGSSSDAYDIDADSESGESGDNDDTSSNEDEDEEQITNDEWSKAAIDILKPLVNNNMTLMYSKHDPWQAPKYVKDYFDETGTVTGKFPDCIDMGNSGEEEDDEDDDDEDEIEKISLKDVPSTLFVCDRKAGKMVGDDNELSTTGGSFGSRVPMHYTAAKVKDELYSNASDINDLIDVIFVKKQKKK